jgi:hypothetical protein
MVAVLALLLTGLGAMRTPALHTPAATAATPDVVDIGAVCAGSAASGFTDTRNTTFAAEIDCFADAGFTQGTGGGSTYEPLAKNLRWQMATFIWRVGEMVAAGDSEITLPAPTDQGFDDIGGLDAEFRDAINGLAAMGVVQGTTASRFDPFAPVRRDQMASFINRMQGALQALKGGDPEGFTTGADLLPDVTPANVHHDNVEGIASVGIVQGRNDGRYHPEITVNRGQMAAFVMRWVAVIDAAGGIPGEPTEEPTCDPGADDCTEEPTQEPTDGACDPGTEVCVGGASVVDTNLNGLLDVGDLMQLDLDPNADELLDEGLPDLFSLTDGDGEAVEVACVSGVTRCTEQDGAVYAAVGEDNMSEVDADGVGGLTLNTAELDELRDGNGEPVGLLPDAGDVDVLGDDAIPDSTVADLLGELLTTDELQDLVEGGGLLPGLEPQLDDVLCDLLGGLLCL